MSPPLPPYREAPFLTFVLLNVASIVEKADEALLPAVYLQVGASLSASPSMLGVLTLLRALTQAATCPFAALLAARYSRVMVVAGGAATWALATSAVGFSRTYGQMAFARAINGVGLALVLPAIQSIVADISPPEKRGRAFGSLSMTGNIGTIVGGVFGVLLAGRDYFGVSGWRMAFHLTAFISYVLAIVIYLFAKEPVMGPKTSDEEPDDPLPLASPPRFTSGFIDAFCEFLEGSLQVAKIKTFQIIVAQGVVGSFPWAALSFAAMWLELMGFSHEATAVLLGFFSVACAAGALFGGFVGDKMAHLYPNSGRIICAQISAGVAVPLSAILLQGIPESTEYAYAYGTIFSIMGFLISWNAGATNNPIFAEIVPDHLRTSIYALDRSLEMGVAAFAPPTVGLLTEWFGYIPSAQGTPLENKANAKALSKGLFATVAFPFVLCCLIYSLLYWTYQPDRDQARDEMLKRSRRHVTLTGPSGGEEEDEILLSSILDSETGNMGEKGECKAGRTGDMNGNGRKGVYNAVQGEDGREGAGERNKGGEGKGEGSSFSLR